jgi:RNA-binding protein
MLTGKQKRFLRGIGHGLSPVVMVGKGEVSDALLRETTEALEAHELIKVKILESCPLDRNDVAQILAVGCEAEVAQILGRTILLYRAATEPKLELPKQNEEKVKGEGRKAKGEK